MLFYALIGLCLALVGVAGLQFMYLFYIDRLDRERKRRVAELEFRCRELSVRLSRAESKLSEQNTLIEKYEVANCVDDEAWADVLEEG